MKTKTLTNPLFITSEYLEQYMSIFDDEMEEPETEPKESQKNSIVIIDIYGPITKRDGWYSWGSESYASMLEAIYKNTQIKGVILKVDSGGGEFGGIAPVYEMIAKRNKPVVAFIDGMAASACYGMICNADMIVAARNTDRVGSIGAYCTIQDFTGYFEKLGIKIIDVYSSLSKDKNLPYREAVKGNSTLIQHEIDFLVNDFISKVKTSRHLNSDDWQTGKLYYAQDALSIGLIDAIDSLDNVIKYFENEI